jgi:hypothetical protein
MPDYRINGNRPNPQVGHTPNTLSAPQVEITKTTPTSKNSQTVNNTPVDYSNLSVGNVQGSQKPFELSDKQIDELVKEVLQTPNALRQSNTNTPFQNDVHNAITRQGNPVPRGLMAQ